MATSDPFSVPGSGNAYIDALLWGGRWDQSTGPITYNLLQDVDTKAWTAPEAGAARAALRSWGEVAAVRFATGDGLSPNLGLFLADLSQLGQGTLGVAIPPQGSIYDGLVAADPYAHPDWLGQLRPGGYSFVTLVHEIGHALGLAHPHDRGGSSGLFPGVSNGVADDTGTYGLNTQLYSIMSYNNVGQPGFGAGPGAYGFAMGPMAFDIAAIQHIYGANMATRTGNDSYALPGTNGIGTGYSCIWDAGGSDRITYSGALDCRIDLRDAPLVGPNAGGYLSRVDGILGGFTIAKGALIETAVAGSGDDLLIGNAAANLLAGGAGADTMRGGTGNDRYYVDNVGDRIIESATGGDADLVRSTISFTLPDHVERLVLGATGRGVGNDAANLLIGSDGSDSLFGAAGDDVLAGGRGGDLLHGGTGYDRATYAATESGVVARLIGPSGGAAAGDTFIGIEHLQGSAFNDYPQGSTVANSLLGGEGNDRLHGEDGNDWLHGGAGFDLLYGGDGNDRAYASDGPGFIDGGGGIDLLYGGNEVDRLHGGAEGDRLFGGAGDDRLYGGIGDDLLYGGDGVDIAYFTGNWDGYEVTRDGSGLVTVADLAPLDGTDDGVDRLLGVEWLRFADIAVRTEDIIA